MVGHGGLHPGCSLCTPTRSYYAERERLMPLVWGSWYATSRRLLVEAKAHAACNHAIDAWAGFRLRHTANPQPLLHVVHTTAVRTGYVHALS
jgi:hypothetical protein